MAHSNRLTNEKIISPLSYIYTRWMHAGWNWLYKATTISGNPFIFANIVVKRWSQYYWVSSQPNSVFSSRSIFSLKTEYIRAFIISRIIKSDVTIIFILLSALGLIANYCYWVFYGMESVLAHGMYEQRDTIWFQFFFPFITRFEIPFILRYDEY